MEETQSFVERWPALERRLHRVLIGMRVPVAWHDDIVQETSITMYRLWDKLDHFHPIWPFVRVVAERVAIAEGRRHSKVELRSELPEEADIDAETLALWRVDIERVRAALSSLSRRDREVLLAEINEALPLALRSSALKMTRMRARKRLRDFLGDGGSIFGVLPSLRKTISTLLPKPTTQVAARPEWMAALVTGTNVLIAVVVGSAQLFVPPVDVIDRFGDPLMTPRSTLAVALASNEGGRTSHAIHSSRGDSLPGGRDARRGHGEMAAGTGVGAFGSRANVSHDDETTMIEICVDVERYPTVSDECEGDHSAGAGVGHPRRVRHVGAKVEKVLTALP